MNHANINKFLYKKYPSKIIHLPVAYTDSLKDGQNICTINKKNFIFQIDLYCNEQKNITLFALKLYTNPKAKYYGRHEILEETSYQDYLRM